MVRLFVFIYLVIIIFIICYLVHIFGTMSLGNKYDFVDFNIFKKELNTILKNNDCKIKYIFGTIYYKSRYYAGYRDECILEIDEIRFQKGNMILSSPIDYFKYICFWMCIAWHCKLNTTKREKNLFN